MNFAFDSEEELEEALSRPTEAVVETLRHMDGDLILLGVAGKMGPTLARMARRALDSIGKKNRVLGVARFSAGGEKELATCGVEPLRCDVLDEEQVARLPDASHVVMMTGMKFGTSGNSSMTWAVNDYAPMLMARRYRTSRIVAFSTGNVYPLTTPASGGSCETDDLAPVGEYAMSALGRERLLEHFSRTWSIPMAILRLNLRLRSPLRCAGRHRQQSLAGANRRRVDGLSEYDLARRCQCYDALRVWSVENATACDQHDWPRNSVAARSRCGVWSTTGPSCVDQWF